MTKSLTLNSMMAVAMIGAMVLSFFAFATQASAAINSSSINITTTNRGTIDNYTSARSHTGDNQADGSFGGDGDDGGDVEGDSGSFNNGGATAGDGGNGGNANDGGFVDTGNATAEAGTENVLNGTDAEVDLTVASADGLNSSSVDVLTDNGDNNTSCSTCNNINNTTKARARTGDNIAQGSVGGDGDDGGDVEGGTGSNNNGGATSGRGGNGGTSDIGGTVFTGHASSTSGTINLLNTTILRVRI